MFDTEMQLATFIFALTQLVILPFQLISCAFNSKDKSRWHFLYLTFFFLAYNVTSGLLPNDKYSILKEVQLSIAWFFGGTMVVCFIYYVFSEFGIKPIAFYTVRRMNIIFTIVFVGLFVIPFCLSNKYRFSVVIFMVMPIIIIGAFTYNTVKILVKKSHECLEKYFRLRMHSAYFAALMIFLTAIIATIGDYQTLEHIVANSAYMIIGLAYIRHIIYKANAIYEVYDNNFRKERKFNQYNLTSREIEIATLILQKYKYKEIADMMYITEKTVSKHASNIFKKTEVKNKKDFLKNF